MLIRISLIVAILAGLAVGVLNFVQIKEKITTLQTDLANTKTSLAAAETERDKNKQEWDKAAAELKTTKETLVTTTEELTKAVEEVATLTKRGEKLTADLNQTREERDTAQNELQQYKVIGFSAKDVATMAQRYKELEGVLAAQQEENRLFAQKIKVLDTALQRYIEPNRPVELPAGLTGKVLVSDPKWNFVVVDIGGDQGVMEYGELLVNRNGRLVAKVRVSKVQKNRAVANVLPGWQLGEVMEGDQVIPAHPSSS